MVRTTLFFALALAAGCAAARDWQMDAGASHLRFAGTAQGEAFKGEFKRFTPKLSLDADQPEATKIEVEIDVTSAGSQNKERDDTLASEDFFWYAKFPKAKFRTTSCKAGSGKSAIQCEAELTIRDKTKKLEFPFTFSASGDKATLKAEVKLNRLDYGIGGGDWADESVVAHEVRVTVDLALK
jgi:polyisoprenoid-binding protein YceI